MSNNSTLEALLVTSPEVLNYNPTVFFEVKPHRKSPIFINIKNTLSNISLRNKISNDLLHSLPSDIDVICGIESGGSYYASIIAEKLNKPLILYRKNDKTYAEKGNFVGIIPEKRNKIVIIDDVIVSGITVEPAINKLRDINSQIYVNAIFSYGNDDFVEKRLSVKVNSIANINKLLEVALDQNILSSKDVNFLKEFISQQKQNFIISSTKT